MSLTFWEDLTKFLSVCSLEIDQNEKVYVTCGICKQIIIDACQILCGCRFCRKCIEEYLQKGGKICPVNENEDCYCIKLKNMDDIHCENETNKMIMKLKVNCPSVGCKIEGNLEEMIFHVKKCKFTKNENCSMSIVKKEQNLENKIDNLERIIEDLSEQLELQKKIIENECFRISTLNDRIQDIEINLNKEKNDDFIWRIEMFSSKKDKGSEIYSAPFYTRKYGYKLRLLFYPNGNAVNCGRYISIYCQILKGKYDNILQWPFKYDVTFSLLDQENKLEDYIYTIRYLPCDEDTEKYQKPELPENKLLGLPKFLEISTLENSPHLLKNDVIFLKFSVNKK